MSDRILEHWHIKLMNWTYYQLGGNAGGISSAYDGDWGMCAPRLPVPLVGEALDTDDLVQKLSDEHRQAIIAVYLWTVPEKQEDKAKVLGLHPNSLRERIKQASYRLDELDHARRRGLPQPNTTMRQAA